MLQLTHGQEHKLIKDTSQPNMKADLQSASCKAIIGEAYQNYERNGHVYDFKLSIFTLQVA